MNRIVTFEDFKNSAKEWNPVLTKVDTLEDAADNINFPHEDYDEFVGQTEFALKQTLYWLKERSINENDIKFIHKICMEGKQIQLGKYRYGNVTVGNNLIPPQPYMIPQMMMSIMPVGTEYQKTEQDIINWYKEFETIHPFEDGNGRVGGIILAAMSKILTGSFIVSKKEYHYFIDHLLFLIDRYKNKLKNENKKLSEEDKYHIPTMVYSYILDKLSIGGYVLNKKLIKILDETGKRKELDQLIDRNLRVTINDRTDTELVNFLKKLK